MVGFSIPTFFTGVLLIVIFSVHLGWFPSIYDTTHVVTNWSSLIVQIKQMIMPTMVLALYNAAQISRFMRASMLDNLNQDYVRTARAKGLRENVVLLVHVLRNSMIPVVTVIAIGVPTVFGWSHYYRTGIQGKRAWTTLDYGHSGQRHTDGSNPYLHFCRLDCSLQSAGRYFVRHP